MTARATRPEPASTFAPYVCWKPSAVDEVLDVVAGHVTDAVFLATHRPPPMFRAETYGSSALRPYGEDQFLNDLLEPNKTRVIVPVIGASGSGKSHLVRWLHARIQGRDEGLRRVVHIPKHHTNLKDVLGLILQGLEGEVFEQFRQRLSAATHALTVDKARIDLLGNLEVMLRGLGPNDRIRVPGTDRVLEKARLADYKKNLPDFITEPVIRNALLREDGVIHRFVSEAIRGRETDRSEVFSITEQDLPLDRNDINEANQNVQAFYRRLVGREEYVEDVLAILNHFLPTALRALYNLSGDDLLELMREVRRALRRTGQELVLLIEDFALLQGIQTQLLEAIIDDNPERDLCDLRVALAVTSGYFDHLDTVHTRLSFIVDLDVSAARLQDADSSTLDRTRLEFVSAYLNATRLGPERLEEALPRVREQGERFQSACTECPYRNVCHEAFGAVTLPEIDGEIGLYPLNPAATGRVTRLSSPGFFNPRRILKAGLQTTLVDAQRGIPEAAFPGELFQGEFSADKLDPAERTDPAVLLGLSAGSEQDKQRQRTLYTFWNPRPPHLPRFKHGFYEALRVPELTGTAAVEPEPTDVTARQPGRAPVETPPTDPPLVRAVKDWAAGTKLPTVETNELRNLVYEAISEAINWEVERLSESFFRGQRLWVATGVSFEGQLSDSSASSEAVRLSLPLAGQDRLSVATALEGLLHFRQHGHWHGPRGTILLQQWKRHLRAWVDEVLRQLRPHERGGLRPSAVPALSETLYWGAVLGNTPDAHGTTAGQHLRALLQAPKRSQGMPRAWQDAQDEAVKHHPALLRALLARVGVGKSGKVRILDVADLLEPLQRAAGAPRPHGQPISLDREQLETVRQRLFGALPQAARASQERARSLMEVLQPALGSSLSEQDWTDTKQAVIDAVAELSSAGALRTGNARLRLSELLDTLQRLPAPTLLDQTAVLATQRDTAGILHRATAWPVADVELLCRSVEQVNVVFSESEGGARSLMEANTFGDYRDITQAIEGKLRSVHDQLVELKGGAA